MSSVMKLGSVVRIPVPDGFTMTSSAPGVVAVTIANGLCQLQALKVGSAVLAVHLTGSLQVTHSINVTAQ